MFFWPQSHCSYGRLQNHLSSSGVEWVKGNQKMGCVARCWQLLLPLSSSEFCKLLIDLEMLKLFQNVNKFRWLSFFFFSFLFSIFHPPAAYAQNFSGINLQKNKFWFQYWHLSSVEGKLTYRCYFSNPKNPTLLVNALCLSNTIIKEGMLILLNFTILTRIGFRYFLLNRILMLLNVNIFFYSCFWYLLYCCTNFFVDTSTHEFFILFYWTLLSSVSLLE